MLRHLNGGGAVCLVVVLIQSCIVVISDVKLSRHGINANLLRVVLHYVGGQIGVGHSDHVIVIAAQGDAANPVVGIRGLGPGHSLYLAVHLYHRLGHHVKVGLGHGEGNHRLALGIEDILVLTHLVVGEGILHLVAGGDGIHHVDALVIILTCGVACAVGHVNGHGAAGLSRNGEGSGGSLAIVAVHDVSGGDNLSIVGLVHRAGILLLGIGPGEVIYTGNSVVGGHRHSHVILIAVIAEGDAAQHLLPNGDMLAVADVNVLGSSLIHHKLGGVLRSRILRQVGVVQRHGILRLDVKHGQDQRMYVAHRRPVGGVSGIGRILLGSNIHRLALHIHSGNGQLYLVRLEVVLRHLNGGGAIGAVHVILHQGAGILDGNNGSSGFHANLAGVSNRLIMRQIGIQKLYRVLTDGLNIALRHPNVIRLFGPNNRQRITVQNHMRLISILQHGQIHIAFGNLEMSDNGAIGVDGAAGNVIISTGVRVRHLVGRSGLIYHQLLIVAEGRLTTGYVNGGENNLIAIVLTNSEGISCHTVSVNIHISGLNPTRAIIEGKVVNAGAGILGLQSHLYVGRLIIAKGYSVQEALPCGSGVADRQVCRIGLIQQQTGQADSIGNTIGILEINRNIADIILGIVHHVVGPCRSGQAIGIADLIACRGGNGDVTGVPTGTIQHIAAVGRPCLRLQIRYGQCESLTALDVTDILLLGHLNGDGTHFTGRFCEVDHTGSIHGCTDIVIAYNNVLVGTGAAQLSADINGVGSGTVNQIHILNTELGSVFIHYQSIGRGSGIVAIIAGLGCNHFNRAGSQNGQFTGLGVDGSIIRGFGKGVGNSAGALSAGCYIIKYIIIIIIGDRGRRSRCKGKAVLFCMLYIDGNRNRSGLLVSIVPRLSHRDGERTACF